MWTQVEVIWDFSIIVRREREGTVGFGATCQIVCEHQHKEGILHVQLVTGRDCRLPIFVNII